MNITVSDSIRVFYALLSRDLYVLSKHLYNFVIDGCIGTVTKALIFCYFFPLMGASPDLIGALYIGSLLGTVVSTTYGQSLRIVFDFKFNRIIDYQLTLPIKTHFLWMLHALTTSINAACIITPSLAGATLFLHLKFGIVKMQVIPFILVYILSFLFLGTLLTTFAYTLRYEWLMTNLWPRRLSPLMYFSSMLFPWKSIYAFWPSFGVLCLCNPMTYVAEGLRSTLFGPEHGISYTICIPMLIVSVVLTGMFLVIGTKKKLNPV
ncbi:MAG TPA: ABC transporter permease [Candidatus Babeliales bacterium]|nr:ABC transporter permease [Candidatus Babeliales bacterium]